MPEEMIAGTEVVESTPIGDTVETVETPVETTEGVESTEQETPETEGVESTIDTSVVAGPDKIKAHIEALKKSDPALAKEIKNLFFAADALKKEIPGGLPEIRQMKATIEELGGKEGIEGIRAQQQEWEQIDADFAAGNVKVLDKFAEFNAEGFAKLIPGAVDKLATVDRDAYNNMLAGPFVATLDSWRFVDNLERLAENLSKYGDDKGNLTFANEIKRIQALATQYDSLKEIAAKVPQKAPDAESKKIAEERAALAQERSKITVEAVSTSTANYANKKIADFLPQEARTRKFDVEKLKTISYGEGEGTAYDRFSNEINSEVANLIRQDAATVKKIQDSIAAGRKDDAIKLSNSKFDAVYQKAVQRVVARWSSTFNPKGASAKPSGNGAAQAEKVEAGVKVLTEAPDTSLIDRTNPNWRENYMLGTAKLKTGQRVKW